MFPLTAYVKTFVLFSRKKPDGHIRVKIPLGGRKIDGIAKGCEKQNVYT